MSYQAAKVHISKLIDSRLNLMRVNRCFNGLTFQKIDDIKAALNTTNSPLSFAIFIVEFWSSIKLLPHILDSTERDELIIMLEKAVTLIDNYEPSTKF